MRVLPLILLLFSIPSFAAAEELKIVTYNIESGSDTQPHLVAADMAEVGQADIWLLQEVAREADVFQLLNRTGNGRWNYLLSKSGNYNSASGHNDQLAILFNTRALDLLEEVELHATRVRADGSPWPNLRAVQFARFRHRQSGEEFWVGNLHQKCCRDSADVRAEQSRVMMEWIKKADVPVILGGDFNVPVEPQDRAGNPRSGSFRIISQTLDWQRPSNPMPTHCGEQSTSMLDHFFTSRALNSWNPRTEIALTSAEYCASESQGGADHRPVVLTLDTP